MTNASVEHVHTHLMVGMIVEPIRPTANFHEPGEVLDVRYIYRVCGVNSMHENFIGEGGFNRRELAVLNGGPKNRSVRWYNDMDLREVQS